MQASPSGPLTNHASDASVYAHAAHSVRAVPLLQVITVNIYRNASESFQTFDYITQQGNFSFWEREAGGWPPGRACFHLCVLLLVMMVVVVQLLGERGG